MFEWDEEKNARNQKERGLAFEDAEQIFDGATLTFEDTRHDYGEHRFVTFGLLDGRMVVIAHTPRSGRTRVISMRKGNQREQETYQERLETHRCHEG